TRPRQGETQALRRALRGAAQADCPQAGRPLVLDGQPCRLPPIDSGQATEAVRPGRCRVLIHGQIGVSLSYRVAAPGSMKMGMPFGSWGRDSRRTKTNAPVVWMAHALMEHSGFFSSSKADPERFTAPAAWSSRTEPGEVLAGLGSDHR